MGSAPAQMVGLTSAEASARLTRDGPNELPSRKPPSAWRRLIQQLTHRFALLLWAAAVLAAVGGLPQLAVAIVIIVVINGTFAFVQEYRADRTEQHLARLLPSDALVVRDGCPTAVPSTELVVGDVVLLEAGDRVCADGEVIDAAELSLDESMLTGESRTVRRTVGEPLSAGTFVAEGEASALVTATGSATRLAGIAALSRGEVRPRSPLALRLDRVVRVVGIVAVVVGVLFFVLALLVGLPPRDGFLFAVGVTVALVPEGLLPTVTLSLALGARRMSERHALVRSLESVETLGSTTYLCTDKTGTLTRNEMCVVQVWTARGDTAIPSAGYDASCRVDCDDEAVRRLAVMAALASTGRVVTEDGAWRPRGDPMEAALHVLALRLGAEAELDVRPERRLPFDVRRKRMSVLVAGSVVVKGAVESVLPRCSCVPAAARATAATYATQGLRVLAVASRPAREGDTDQPADAVERDLELLGLIGLEDPPRDGAKEAVTALRAAGIRVAMVTGDHPGTAASVARQVGLLLPDSPVVEASALPKDAARLGEFLDRDGVVVARADPAGKLRIAEALQARGHVVAMTGDGVNDGPALSRADIGIALGRSGTDVARETADLVLLDDHLLTVVAAVEYGRTTFLNIRKFLTYHLTDNVAELAPFAVWALSGGRFPLALAVLQVLALDIGTDLLPAIALGNEPSDRARVLDGPMPTTDLVDRRLLARALGVLGPTEAVGEMIAFTLVLLAGGWVWMSEPDPALLAAASGTAFAAVVLGQLANAFACRSATRWAGAVPLTTNRFLLWAVAAELVMLVVFLGVPAVADLLGGSWPPPLGWLLALLVAPAVIGVDALHKTVRANRRRQVPIAAAAG